MKILMGMKGDNIMPIQHPMSPFVGGTVPLVSCDQIRLKSTKRFVVICVRDDGELVGFDSALNYTEDTFNGCLRVYFNPEDVELIFKSDHGTNGIWYHVTSYHPASTLKDVTYTLGTTCIEKRIPAVP